MNIAPYIMFNGNCEEALNFYVKALNGEIKGLMRFEGSPAESMVADKQKVLHAMFQADQVFFMASDGTEAGANNGGMVHLSLDFDNAEQEQKVFDALAEGGKITSPLQDTFWGATFGMLTDRFGVNWMFNYDKQKPGS
jgi:PhnB protein